MRIVIDMQGAQTDSRFRGIGRYTLSLTRALLTNCGEHEILLALNGSFPESIPWLRSHFDGLLPPENIVVWKTYDVLGEHGVIDGHKREIAEIVREAFLNSLLPDVIHISSLFEGFSDNAITSIDKLPNGAPVSAIVYDLIPFLYPEQYLKGNKRYEQYYYEKVDLLKKTSLNFAISEFTRAEVIDTIDVDPTRVINIFGAIDENLKKLCAAELPEIDVLSKFGISRSFLLYTGGADNRKNLPALIEAYANLPIDQRNGYQLVFAGRLTEMMVSQLETCAEKAGLESTELIFTGFVTDPELAVLYSTCALYIFPSRHEGLGLPVLEAMAFGAPVIASNASSLPEVVNQPEALFDPLDVKDISRKISQALVDGAFRERLIRHGQRRAQEFTWDESARRVLSGWTRLQSHVANNSKSWCSQRSSYDRIYKDLLKALSNLLSSSISVSELKDLANCLAHNEREAMRIMRGKGLTSPIKWRIEGPFDSSYSLALVNRETARALRADGHDVSLHSTEGPGDFMPDVNYLSEQPDIDAMYRKSLNQNELDVDVVSRNLYPPRVMDLKGRYNFLHVYAWEESGFPVNWADEFNCALSGMMVASEHVRKIMIDHGISIPVSVCGEGINHWTDSISDPSYTLDAKRFRFLHVSSCFPRKGVDILLRAYGKAFTDQDPVSLIIKTFRNQHNEVHQWLEDAMGSRHDYPHVVIIEQDLPQPKLKTLYESCHVLVAPSRAEGFGLPLAEAMMSNLAVLTTGWGGQLDFCTDDTAWLIDYSFTRPTTHFGLHNSVWAEPNENHLAELMKSLSELPEHALQTKVKAGQQLLQNRFLWSHVARRLVDAATACAEQTTMCEPTIAWVTPWNTRCGIAAYSRELINNMPCDVSIYAAKDDEITRQDDNIVDRCWYAGHGDDLFELSCAIELKNPNVIVIQFNYAFFNVANFADFLYEQIDGGRVVIVTLHSTVDPENSPEQNLSVMSDALRCCDRVLVHTHADLNRLKQIGVIENVTLFPHGIISYSAQPLATKRPTEFVIGSYGFFLPNKGLIELIEAIKILRDQGFNCRLLMTNARYPTAASTEIIEIADRRVKELDLGSHVSICTDFLEDYQSLSILSSTDLIVFPYQNSGESSSAAVRFGIASGQPVAVTPLEVFDDVQTLVNQLPGIAPREIACGILSIAKAIENNSTEIQETRERTQKWRDEFNYGRVGPRMLRLIEAVCANKR